MSLKVSMTTFLEDVPSKNILKVMMFIDATINPSCFRCILIKSNLRILLKKVKIEIKLSEAGIAVSVFLEMVQI